MSFFSNLIYGSWRGILKVSERSWNTITSTLNNNQSIYIRESVFNNDSWCQWKLNSQCWVLRKKNINSPIVVIVKILTPVSADIEWAKNI